ncbi:alpha/beta hydrolase [Terrabacter sp. NPDC000476]|uniref:alpha/beta hydrolase n=1 Tax=Terrabacter sp. NPDC000476 TaxID=3154258 RepID=UPI003326339E
MRGLRRGRLSAEGNAAGRRHDLLSRLRAPLVSAALLGGLLALAVAPTSASSTGTPGTAGTPGSTGSGAVTGAAAAEQPEERPGGDLTPFAFTGPVDPEPEELAAFYGKRVRWSPCEDGGGFDCATVTVPVDYAHPEGATTGIALRRLPAAGPAPRIGSLFLNPGGPGGSGIDFAEAAPDVFGDAVLERYDVVGFDPRGLGESDPVDCLTDADLDEVFGADPTPDTAAERAAAARAPAARARRCLERGGALAGRMGSEFVARDLDVLRSAVGDERLNYYGVSYGTMIGALYADFFPARVGHVVLDSAVRTDGLDPGTPTQQEIDAYARGWAYEFDDVFDDFVTACVDEADDADDGTGCALGSDTAEASRRIVGLLDRLDRTPLPTGLDSLPQLTEGWARTAIGFGLGDPDAWPDLTAALAAALEDDDGEGLAWFAMDEAERDDDGSYPAASFGRAQLLVRCSDWPSTAWDAAVPSADVLANHPLWARVEPPVTDPCTGWQGVRRTTLLVGADVATPVLVIGNAHDRTTPIEDTEAMAASIVRSRFVTVEAEGHGAYDNGNECADAVVDGYLARDEAPEDDYVCGS